MFNLKLVFKRLQEEVVDLKIISDSVDLALINDQITFDAPSAYIQLDSIVLPENESGSSISLKGKKRQYVLVKFSVTTVTNNPRYAPSSEISLEPILEKIHDALIGWTPEAESAQACQLISGKMKIYNEKMQIWQDDYQFRYAIGKN